MKFEIGGDNRKMIQEEGAGKNDEPNPHKGEDNYGFLFANNKLQFDSAVATSQINNGTASLALQQAVSFQQKANEAYLANMDAREKAQNRAIDQNVAQSGAEHTQKMEHEDEHDLHHRDNDRMTLDELYNISTDEAASLTPVLTALANLLRDQKKGDK
jgi:hypothetical protein